MNKFKIGDEVVVVKSSLPTYWYADKVGQKFKVLDDSTYHSSPFHVKLKSSGWAEESDLVLASDFEKESISKFLKENSWWIKCESQSDLDLIDPWLVEHFGVGLGIDAPSSIGYVSRLPDYPNEVLWGIGKKDERFPEIILEFETLIKSVKLPEPTPKEPVLTEQQIKIAELEDTIAKASAQINQLKEMK